VASLQVSSSSEPCYASTLWTERKQLSSIWKAYLASIFRCWSFTYIHISHWLLHYQLL